MANCKEYQSLVRNCFNEEDFDEAEYGISDVVDFCEDIEKVLLSAPEEAIAKLFSNLEDIVEESLDDGGPLDDFLSDNALVEEMVKLSGLKSKDVLFDSSDEVIGKCAARLIVHNRTLVTTNYVFSFVEWMNGNVGIPNNNCPDILTEAFNGIEKYL